MSRLRCPLRTPGVMLGKVADAGADTGADTGAGYLVSMGRSMAFGAVDKVLGSAGNISAMIV